MDQEDWKMTVTWLKLHFTGTSASAPAPFLVNAENISEIQNYNGHGYLTMRTPGAGESTPRSIVVHETLEEIEIMLGLRQPEPVSAFSLEELESAENHINGTHMTWTQMWSHPFKPSKKGTD
jgi:hypothetical protein